MENNMFVYSVWCTVFVYSVCVQLRYMFMRSDYYRLTKFEYFGAD